MTSSTENESFIILSRNIKAHFAVTPKFIFSKQHFHIALKYNLKFIICDN